MKTLKEYQAKYGKLEGEKQYCIDRAWEIDAEQRNKKRKTVITGGTCSTTLKKGKCKTATKKVVTKKQSVKKATTAKKPATKKTVAKKSKRK